MNQEGRMELFFKYRDIAYNIAKNYIFYDDIDTITDYAIDGLMHAVDSIESQQKLDKIDFKMYAEFYIKSEINRHISKQSESDCV